MPSKTYYQSPIGCLEICGSELGLQSVKRVEKEGTLSLKSPMVLKDCKKQLEEYFAGKRQQFELKMD